MALTSAVANAAAAAAAAGQGKKAAQVQLQAELNTDDEWNKFMSREGLLGESVIYYYHYNFSSSAFPLSILHLSMSITGLVMQTRNSLQNFTIFVSTVCRYKKIYLS